MVDFPSDRVNNISSFSVSKGLGSRARVRLWSRWESYTMPMALPISEYSLVSQLFSVWIIVEKRGRQTSTRKHWRRVFRSSPSPLLISCREKRQKIEDIKKNIRDAILVRLAYWLTPTHIYVVVLFSIFKFLGRCSLPYISSVLSSDYYWGHEYTDTTGAPVKPKQPV